MSTVVKLVRDEIPDIIERKGEKVPEYRTNFGHGGERHLWNKLEEEKWEFLQAKTKEEQAEELADMMEVIYGLAHRRGIERKHLGLVCTQKYVERGGFEKGIVMAVELPPPKKLPCGCHCAGGCCDPFAPCAHPCKDHTPP